MSQGKGIPEIGKRLHREASIIRKDLKRNGGNSPWWDSLSPLGKGRESHRRAVERRKQSRQKERLKSKEIRDRVYSLIKEYDWSPEIISLYFKEFQEDYYVCTGSIYNWIEADVPELKKYLFFGGKPYRRNRNKAPTRNTKQAAAKKKPLSERSELAENRIEFGHFEGDALVSSKNTVSLINVIERSSRYMILKKILACSGENGKKAFCEALEQIPEELRLSMTLDRGSENSLHPEIEQEAKIPIFFCEPYRSFEKGTVENRNRYIRKHLPKGTDFSSVPFHELERIVELHNNRPMKCLAMKTPKQVFEESLLNYQHTLH